MSWASVSRVSVSRVSPAGLYGVNPRSSYPTPKPQLRTQTFSASINAISISSLVPPVQRRSLSSVGDSESRKPASPSPAMLVRRNSGVGARYSATSTRHRVTRSKLNSFGHSARPPLFLSPTTASRGNTSTCSSVNVPGPGERRSFDCLSTDVCSPRGADVVLDFSTKTTRYQLLHTFFPPVLVHNVLRT